MGRPTKSNKGFKLPESVLKSNASFRKARFRLLHAVSDSRKRSGIADQITKISLRRSRLLEDSLDKINSLDSTVLKYGRSGFNLKTAVQEVTKQVSIVGVFRRSGTNWSAGN